MEKILKEIINGLQEYEKNKKANGYVYGVKGIGSKAYINKRVDILREELLKIKKEL